MIGRLEVVNEVECPADKLYKLWKDDVHEIPKHIPHIYKSVEILEDGDHGAGVSPVKFWHYAFGGRVINVKEKTVVNDEERSVNHVVLDGDVFNTFKSFQAKVTTTPRVIDGKVDGSLVKWELIYEKKSEDVPDPYDYLAWFEQITKDLNSEFHLKKGGV